MTTTPLKLRRRVSGAAGAPSSALSAEPSINMVDGVLYIGVGDDGGGNATSVVAFAKTGFDEARFMPAGGGVGQALVKTGVGDYAVTWGDVASGGSSYTGGTGISIDSGVISIDDTVVVTVDALTTALAGKANTSHTHSAADITSGTFDVARIPVLPSQTVQISSGAISDLTSPQQTNIVSGTVVTTTDGRRWVYASGNKTLEASYIALADITPEWAVIAGKPSFATVATTGAYTDLTGRPTLSTMASQSAADVAITGGTIDGVVLDGGTF